MTQSYSPKNETQGHYIIGEDPDAIRVESQTEIWGMPTQCPLETARERGDIIPREFQRNK